RPDAARVVALTKTLETMRQARAAHNLKRYGAAPDLPCPTLLTYDRTGSPPARSLQTTRQPISTSRPAIDPRGWRIDQATQRWCGAHRDFERASDRFGRAHRAFANDFEQALIAQERRHLSTAILRKYGAPVVPAEHSKGRNHDLEHELE